MKSTFGSNAIRLLLTAVLVFSNLPAIAGQEPPLKLQLSPSTIPAGRSRTIKIKAESGADLTGFELQKPPEDTGVLIEEPGGQLVDGKTAIVARVQVDEDADEQVLPLTVVKKKDGKVTATYTVDLTISTFTPKALQKQPVPSNLDYEVDSMVQPMSYKGAKDIFGRRVADQYYAVVVGLGNNTGFDLQINKIGFRTLRMIDVPAVDSDGDPVFDEYGKVKMRKDLMSITAIDRSLVRSSIERDQDFGVRALALNLIGGIGTLATGFLPFFHALGPRANFSSFTSVLNGQLRDGFTVAVPDLTIRHLNRLDSSLVMDQDFVLPNNSERNTVVFVPRLALGLEGKERDNLLKVRETLGDLVIVGRKIQRFANRQIVLRSDRPSREPTPFAPPSRPAGPISIDSVTPALGALSESQDVVITGAGFTPGTAVKVMFGDRETTGVAVSPTTVTATVPPIATAGPIDVEVIAGDDRKATREKAYLYIDELTVESIDPATGPAEGERPTVKIIGRGFVSGLEVKFGEKVATDVAVANDHNSITVTLPANAAGKVDVVVKNKNGKRYTKPNGFTYAQ